MSDKKEETKKLLTFPCDFPIKVFGLATKDFETEVMNILLKHIPAFSSQDLRARSSENGKYLAFSFSVHVNSQEQLDAIYKDLTASPLVLMAL